MGYVARYGSNDLFIVSQLNGMEHYGGYLIGGTTLAPSVTAPLPQQYIALDPVNVATGAVNEDIVDVNIPAIGLPLTFSRHYDSNLVGMPNSLLGRGWYHNYSDRLVVSGTNQVPAFPPPNPRQDLEWIDSKGHRFLLDGVGATWVVAAELKGEFIYDVAIQKYIFRDRSGTAHRFNADGTLDAILDMYGNRLQLTYAGGRLLAVESMPVAPGYVEAGSTAVSKRLNFRYDANGRLASVSEDPETGGRVWKYQVLAIINNEAILTRVESPPAEVNGANAGVAVNYSYYDFTNLNHPLYAKLAEITHPDGKKTTHTYYANGRAFQATDPDGHVQRFHFDLYRNRTTAFDERLNGTTYTYSTEKGNLLQVQYPDRSRETNKWNEAEQRLESHTNVGNITETYSYDTSTAPGPQDDPFDNVWQVDLKKVTGYDGNGNPVLATIQVLDAGVMRDLITKYQYDPATNGERALTRQSAAEGDTSRRWHSTKGLCIRVRRQRARTSQDRRIESPGDVLWSASHRTGHVNMAAVVANQCWQCQ